MTSYSPSGWRLSGAVRLFVAIAAACWLDMAGATAAEPNALDATGPAASGDAQQPAHPDAQDPAPPAAPEQDRIQRLGLSTLAEPGIAERLRLSDEQKARVAELLQQRAERAAKTDPKVQYMVYAETERRLARILTDEQWHGWEALASATSKEGPLPAQVASAETSARPLESNGSDATELAQGVETEQAGLSEAASTQASDPEVVEVSENESAKPPETAPPAPPETGSSEPSRTASAAPAEDGKVSPVESQEVQPAASEAAQPAAGEAAQPAASEGAQPAESQQLAPAAAVAGEPAGPSETVPAKPPQEEPSDLWTLFGPEQQPGPPPGPGGPGPVPAQPPKGVPEHLRFNFRDLPWENVLHWLADCAGLSLVYKDMPKGTCNYVDTDREYTVGEAIDVLNRLLLIEGYKLVRRDKLLVLANSEDQIASELVREVTPEQLDGLGESEYVGVVFQLNSVTAEEAQKEIQQLNPDGTIVPLPKSRQIWVTGPAGRLRTIREVIQRIDGPDGAGSEQLRSFEFQYVTPDQVLAILRPLLGIPADQSATPDGSLHFALDPLSMRLWVSGTPSKLDHVAKLLESIEKPGSGETEFNGGGAAGGKLEFAVYPVAPADPKLVLKVMQTLLAGRTGVRLNVDEETGNLSVLGLPEDHARVQQALEKLRISTTHDVIQLRQLDPEVAVTAINNMFGGEDGSKTLKVDAEPTTRMLILRGTETEIEQVRALLAKMGETGAIADSGGGGGGRGNVRVYPVPGRTAESVLQQLQQFWPAMRNNKIRVVTPSAVSPTMRSRVPTGAWRPDEGPLEGRVEPQGFGPRSGARRRPSLGEPASRPPAAVVPFGEPPEAPPARLQAPSPEFEGDSAKAATAAALSRPRVFFVSEAVRSETEAGESAANGPSAEADPTQPTKEPAPIVVTVVPGGIMAASEDKEALDAFENLLTALAGGGYGGPNMTIFYLRHAKASSVAQTLMTILSSGASFASSRSSGASERGRGSSSNSGSSDGSTTGSLLDLRNSITTSGPIYITPDDRLNALFVQASPEDQDRIEEILSYLDQMESPEEVSLEPTPHLIRLVNTRAEEVAEIVRDVFQSRMVGGSRGGRGGPQMDPRQMFEMMARMRGGSSRGSSRGGSSQETETMSIGVDSRTNTLIVWAPESLYKEVEGLVQELDQTARGAADETIMIATLKRSNPEAVGEALSAVFGESVNVGGTSSSSRRSSSSRSSSNNMRGRTNYIRSRFGGSPFGGSRPSFGGGSSSFGRGRSSYGGGRSRSSSSRGR